MKNPGINHSQWLTDAAEWKSKAKEAEKTITR